MIRRAILGFLLAIAAEAIVVLAAWIPRRTLPYSAEGLGITFFWAVIFGVVVSIGLLLLPWARSRPTRNKWLLFLIMFLALPVIVYGLVYVISQGSIANLGYPLLLVFLSGSIFPSTILLWDNLIAGVTGLASVVLIGVIFSLVPQMANRKKPIEITIVKFYPDESLTLSLTASLGTQITDYERSRLIGLGLHGRAEVTRRISIGPGTSASAHMFIILTHPLEAPENLHEPADEIAYIQGPDGWKAVPENAHVTFRTVELYPANGKCTAISTWRSIGEQAGTGGPCW